jgi:hypothetical protein
MWAFFAEIPKKLLTLSSDLLSCYAQLSILFPKQAPNSSPSHGRMIAGMGVVLLAGVAQLVEQLICNQQVAGSSPIASSCDDGFCPEDTGQVAKRSNATDCKSVGSGLRRFDSSPAHVSIMNSDFIIHNWEPERGSNSVGRVTAFQAVGRGFESRLPL